MRTDWPATINVVNTAAPITATLIRNGPHPIINPVSNRDELADILVLNDDGE
jgi:hypothetical protein